MSGQDEEAQANRLEWVDVARGIGIILVVYAHVLRGHMPLASGEGWAPAHDRLIYAFHMPLFFVLSGLFLWQSIGRDRAKFLTSRWWQMIWPYLLWSFFTAAIELAMAPFVNSPLTTREALMIPLVPIEQYWFLYALLIHQLVIAAIWPRKWLLVPIALAGLGLVIWLGGALIQVRAFLFLPYVVAGILLASSLQALASRSAVLQGVVALVSWAVFAFLLQSQFRGSFHLSILALGFTGSIATIATAMLLARTPIVRPLVLLGEASLAIYLAHTIFSAGSRIGLNLLGVVPTHPLSLGAATVFGLVAPWLIFNWAKNNGYTRPLGFGGQGPKAKGAIA